MKTVWGLLPFAFVFHATGALGWVVLPPGIRACNKIVALCKTAGFFEGGHGQGKDLWGDCYDLVLAGKNVAVVKIDPNDLKACQAEKIAGQALEDLSKNYRLKKGRVVPLH
jgi:hypothetical protein